MALTGIILAALVGSYFSYSNYWAEDEEIEINEAYVSYFKETYSDSRSQFLENSDQLNKIFDTVVSGRIMVPSEVDDDLSIDWTYVPGRTSMDKLLILNSGLHGIEGYTGSAIQNMFMNEMMADLPENMGVLMIHGINAFGFKYRRKVTENNIDLNRNCVRGQTGFDIENDGYGKLEDMLMPTGNVDPGSLSNKFFYLNAIYKIVKESMGVLRQAALQGQYEYDKGIYYGGRDYEPQIKSLEPLLQGIISEYKMVLNIDLHTAYGERGKLHLFVDKPDDPNALNAIETIYKGQQIDWGNTADFYTINGEYIVWVNSLVPDVTCVPMLFEFGTLNSQETFGALKSIHTMIMENQGVHYGYANEEKEEIVKDQFSRMYYPTSPLWRTKVMNSAKEMLAISVNNLEKL